MLRQASARAMASLRRRWRDRAIRALGAVVIATNSSLPLYGLVPISMWSRSSIGCLMIWLSLNSTGGVGSGSVRISDDSTLFNRNASLKTISSRLFPPRGSYLSFTSNRLVSTPIRIFGSGTGVLPPGSSNPASKGSGCVGNGPLYDWSCQLSFENARISSGSRNDAGSGDGGAAISYLMGPNGRKSAISKSESFFVKFQGAARLRNAMISSFWLPIVLASYTNNSALHSVSTITPPTTSLLATTRTLDGPCSQIIPNPMATVANMSPANRYTLIGSWISLRRTFTRVFPTALLFSIWFGSAILLIRAGWNR